MNIKKIIQNAWVLALFLPQAALAQIGSFKPTGTGLSSRPVEQVATSILNAVLGFLFIVALAVIIWGVFLAGTSDEGFARGRNAIVGGIIGLVIILIAYAIVNFVIGTVG